MRPFQQPYPPLWYMRNAVTAAMEGMHTIIVGSIDGLVTAVQRYRTAWEEHQGVGATTIQGDEPLIGPVVHLVIAETDDEALQIARPAWERYRWNLDAPRRLEAEKRNLSQFMSTKDGSFGFVGDRPAGLRAREMRRDIDAELERFDQQSRGTHPNRLGGVALAGSRAAVREYMDEYLETGANYFVCSFQWGDLTHEHAMRSIELFASDVMPRYRSTCRTSCPTSRTGPTALAARPRPSDSSSRSSPTARSRRRSPMTRTALATTTGPLADRGTASDPAVHEGGQGARGLVPARETHPLPVARPELVRVRPGPALRPRAAHAGVHRPAGPDTMARWLADRAEARPRAAYPTPTWTWAALMRRVVDLDLLAGPRVAAGCG